MVLAAFNALKGGKIMKKVKAKERKEIFAFDPCEEIQNVQAMIFMVREALECGDPDERANEAAGITLALISDMLDRVNKEIEGTAFLSPGKGGEDGIRSGQERD